MKLSFRSMAKFDAIVAEVRRALAFPFEGLLLPPPRWEDQAYLFDADKLLVVLAGLDEEALREYPQHQVALRDFVVAAEDADYPLNETESRIFAESVRAADAAFEGFYQGSEWHPQVARLIVELKLAARVADNKVARIETLSPLRDALGATLILHALPEPIDLETSDPIHREYILELSLFMGAELQLFQPLPEQEAVRRIRNCLPQCPANLVGTKVRFGGVSPIGPQISFRVRQF